MLALSLFILLFMAIGFYFYGVFYDCKCANQCTNIISEKCLGLANITLLSEYEVETLKTEIKSSYPKDLIDPDIAYEDLEIII